LVESVRESINGRSAGHVVVVPLALGAAAPAFAADGDTITMAREHLALLQEQTREHREFLELIYTIWTALLGAVVLGVVGLLTFFNVRTRKDVERSSNQERCGADRRA
jgi:heme/copper-type cytochrome/quinol oxidase subunit 2